MGIIDLSRKLLFQASNDAQKNAEQYSDESYDQFVRNTRLCTRRPIKDSQFVCVSIHRETKQLWKYDSKVVGSRGVFDVLDFEGRVPFQQMTRATGKATFNSCCFLPITAEKP